MITFAYSCAGIGTYFALQDWAKEKHGETDTFARYVFSMVGGICWPAVLMFLFVRENG